MSSIALFCGTKAVQFLVRPVLFLDASAFDIWEDSGGCNRTAADVARQTEAIRISLATQISNVAAQSLYESLWFRGYCMLVFY